jgi:hypothetical protein
VELGAELTASHRVGTTKGFRVDCRPPPNQCGGLVETNAWIAVQRGNPTDDEVEGRQGQWRILLVSETAVCKHYSATDGRVKTDRISRFYRSRGVCDTLSVTKTQSN